MWLTLSMLLLPTATAAEIDTRCRWTDLRWSHDEAVVQLPGTATPFARLQAGATVNGKLGPLGGDLRLRLTTTGAVQVTGDLAPGEEVFRLSEGPVDLGQGAMLTTGSLLRPTGVVGAGVTVQPLLPTTDTWTTQLAGRASCQQLTLTPSAGLYGESALAEAGHAPGPKRWAKGALVFRDANGEVMVRTEATFPMVVWVQETNDTQVRVLAETNGVVWSSWLDADRLQPIPKGRGRGGGGSGEGWAGGPVPMKEVRDARCPQTRPLWFVGPDGRAQVGTVSPEQVLRDDGATPTGVRVTLLNATVEPVDGGRFEVEGLDGCAVEVHEVPR